MQKPLQGVRILDLSRLLPGPCASMILRELGATVDKVEDPIRGDYLRSMAPLHDGMNPCFRVLCAGNRSVALDLANAEGQATLRELVLHYDVLIESFRSGVMARWSLDHDSLAKLYPKLVYCSISGFGANGASKAAHDLNFLAESGALALSQGRDGVPSMPGIQTADIGSAYAAATRITAALYARHSTGLGAFVDVSMFDAAKMFALYSLAAGAANENHGAGQGPFNGGLAVYGVYKTSDQKCIAIAALEPKFLRNLAIITGVELTASALQLGTHQTALRALLATAFSSSSAEEWRVRAIEH